MFRALRVRDQLGETLMEKNMIGDILCEYVSIPEIIYKGSFNSRI